MNSNPPCTAKKSSKNPPNQTKSYTQKIFPLSDDEKANCEEKNNQIILIQDSPPNIIDLDAKPVECTKNNVLSVQANTKNHQELPLNQPLKRVKNNSDLMVIGEGQRWMQTYKKRYRCSGINNGQHFLRNSENDEAFIEIVNLTEEYSDGQKMNEGSQGQKIIDVDSLQSAQKMQRREE